MNLRDALATAEHKATGQSTGSIGDGAQLADRDAPERGLVAAPPDDRRELLASLLRDLRVVRGRRAFGETAASARALADALGQLSATLVVFTAQLSERLTADSVADTMVGEP